MDMLRKKDLHPKVGVAKSTVADWIEDFSVYIPKVKHGNVTYYKAETIDVLNFIKQCRDQNYQKQQIMQMLSEKGFPITVEDAIEDVKKALEVESPRDTLLAVMQTMGEAVADIADQQERLDGHDKLLESLGEKQNGQDESLKTLERRQGEIEKRTDEVDYLKQEIEALRKELAATKEEVKEIDSRSFFKRLFGRKKGE